MKIEETEESIFDITWCRLRDFSDRRPCVQRNRAEAIE